VRINVTLTIEADVLKAARKAALNRDTSVNALVREYLAQLAKEEDQQEKARTELAGIFKRSKYKIGEKIEWKREDLYDRG
jgi:hypothetical protein